MKSRYSERRKVKIYFLPHSADYFYANADCPCLTCRVPCIIGEFGAFEWNDFNEIVSKSKKAKKSQF